MLNIHLSCITSTHQSFGFIKTLCNIITIHSWNGILFTVTRKKWDKHRIVLNTSTQKSHMISYLGEVDISFRDRSIFGTVSNSYQEMYSLGSLEWKWSRALSWTKMGLSETFCSYKKKQSTNISRKVTLMASFATQNR